MEVRNTMLDLTLMNNDLYEIRLLDGTELKLKRPTQAMMQLTVSLQEFSKNEMQADTINALTELFTQILNRNTDGKKFEAAQIAQDYDFTTITYVVEDYFNYWNKEVDEKVNFRQSQQKQ